MLRSIAIRALSTSSSAAPPRFKHSTGLVGLEVDPQAREKLLIIYKETIEKAKELNDSFKKEIISMTEYRLSVCEKFECAEQIEKEIQSGQIEELLDEAKDELGLVKFLLKDERKNDPNAVFYQ